MIEVKGIPEGYQRKNSLLELGYGSIRRQMALSLIETTSEIFKRGKTSLRIRIESYEKDSSFVHGECSHPGAELVFSDLKAFLQSQEGYSQKERDLDMDVLKILKETYARGEISTEEFLHRKQVLESPSRSESLKREVELRCKKCEELYLKEKIEKEKVIQYMQDLAKSIMNMRDNKKIDNELFEELRKVVDSYYHKFTTKKS